jgi:phosphopentomutase
MELITLGGENLKRIILIVMDSVGIGELPDASEYGDAGSNTLSNIKAMSADLALPNLNNFGLSYIEGVKGFNKVDSPCGCYGRMSERSPGKDTTTGHWEIAGIILDKPFPLYPEGFPKKIIKRFEAATGLEVLGNKPASGTQIIKELGEEHVKTGRPIVYTSADSVFQIAAHEDVIPVERLYDICMTARGILTGAHAVSRVIARPFTGSNGNFTRTVRRKDYSVEPFSRTVLDYTVESGYEVKAVGKIEDIFAKKGITEAVHTHSNTEGIDTTIDYMSKNFEGIVFTNLVDFDMLYGHRNNIEGYANALMEFDARLPELIKCMKPEDMLIITADHGCDPTTQSTDHSREYVPLLVYGKNLKSNINLGTRSSFSDIAKTVEDYLNLDCKLKGKSFYEDVRYY